LTFKERREHSELPTAIEHLEAEIATLHQAMAQGDFYRQPGERIASEQERLRGLESRLATAYERWEELEQRST
jgi:ATP-binding cassette subfamily F protein uup